MEHQMNEEKEVNYLKLLLEYTIKVAEESKATTRDFFLGQAARLEEKINKLGFDVKYSLKQKETVKKPKKKAERKRIGVKKGKKK